VSVAQRKGAPGKADFLFSRIIRSRGFCQYPGCDSTGPYDTAHVIGRGYSATRCMEDNSWCLCRTHHALVDNWPDEKLSLVAQTIGMVRYLELRDIAKAGPPPPQRLFWPGEVERLTERCRELGIDTKRRAA
jgi:hypothetical protein